MSLDVVHYNEASTFASRESADEYVDTAIARNIQHSRCRYQYEGYFRHLRDLYEKNELTSAVNCVMQDWKSHDLGLSANNQRRDRANPTDILGRVDLTAVSDNLRKLLEIRKKDEQTVAIDNAHATENGVP